MESVVALPGQCCAAPRGAAGPDPGLNRRRRWRRTAWANEHHHGDERGDEGGRGERSTTSRAVDWFRGRFVPGRPRAKHALQNGRQAFDVRIPSGVAQLDGLASGEPFEIGRQLRSGWHDRSFDQHGNDPHVAGESDPDLETDEIVRIVEPPPAVPVGARQPLPAHDREQHIAGTDGALEDVHEVDAGFDVRDVHEHRGPAEPCPQVVEEPAGMAGTVFTPVADEDAGRDVSSR